jgi:hypothetical protein
METLYKIEVEITIVVNNTSKFAFEDVLGEVAKDEKSISKEISQ